MTAQEIEKEIKSDGWYYHSTKGSHKHFKHRGDIHPKTIETIRKQAGLK